jgi:hypothetical protein
MMQRLLTLFKDLSRIKALQQENKELKLELLRRQEAINKTNAYWKGVIRKINSTNR